MPTFFIQCFKHFFYSCHVFSMFLIFLKRFFTFRSMLLIASCPVTGIVGITSSTCLLLTKHCQNTNKMFKLLLRVR